MAGLKAATTPDLVGKGRKRRGPDPAVRTGLGSALTHVGIAGGGATIDPVGDADTNARRLDVPGAVTAGSPEHAPICTGVVPAAVDPARAGAIAGLRFRQAASGMESGTGPPGPRKDLADAGTGRLGAAID